MIVLRALFALSLGTSVLAGQNAPTGGDAADPDAWIRRFAELGFRQKAVIIRTVQRQVELLPDPLIARIRRLQVDVTELPEAPESAPVHDPTTWAKDEHEAGRAPSRKPLSRESEAWQDAARRFARPAYLPSLRREVRYDWQSGRIVREPSLDYVDVFANLAHGHPPGTDHAIARILATLDADSAARPLAAWFGHAYCDLDAHSYPGLTFYDAWYSGEIIDVPDVDAIPFARQVLGDRRLRSPLSGPPRDRLYQEIANASKRYRIHRTTAEAAAAAWIAAAPDMDPMYALLVPRFHYLYASHEDDLEEVAAIVRSEDRDRILADVDDRIRQTDGTAWEVREGRAREIAATRARIQELARAALERFAGDR